MQTESQTTIHALYRLIEEGCSTTSNSERTLQLQKAILKKFFKASDVEITHLQNEVSIVMRPMLSDACSTEINLEIPKKQFSGFLQNCIKPLNRWVKFITKKDTRHWRGSGLEKIQV